MLAVKRRMAAAAVLAAAALVATACSGSGSGGGASARTSGAASAAAGGGGAASAPSHGTTALSVAYAATGAGFSDLYVGVDQGIFKKHGLDVTLKQVTPANLVPGLLSGSVQIGGGVADGTAAAVLKGENLKYVALTEGTYNLQLWVSSKVKSISDLAGKSLALTTQGSETDFALTNFLQANNIPNSSVQRKYLVSTAQMLSGISSGAVDGGLFQPPTAQTLLKSGGKVLSSLSNLPYAVGAYIATSSYVQKNPQVISEFAAAEAENLQFLQQHPAETQASIVKHSGNPDPGDAKIAYDFFVNVWKKDPTVTPNLIQAAFTRAATATKQTPPSDVSQYIYTASS